MVASQTSPEAAAIAAFNRQLTNLGSLTARSRIDPDFIRWRATTTEVFKHFLPNSEAFATFSGIPFEGGYFEVPGYDAFAEGCNAARAALQAAIEHITFFGIDRVLTNSSTADAMNSDSQRIIASDIAVLISHSSKDKSLAEALINLLRSGLGLLASDIRCSSVDGYRLPAGVNTDDQLREEIKSAGVLIGLLTPSSLSSTYVLFELGARWGAKLPIIPLLAGIKPDDMKGPHQVLNALSCESESQLIQLIEDTGKILRMAPQSAASYLAQVRAVRELSAFVGPGVDKPIQAQLSGQPTNEAGFRLSVSLDGETNRQVLRVASTEPLIAAQIDYMLTDETSIASQKVSESGKAIEIPVDYDSLRKVFSTPRSDMNGYDHSGPMKLGIELSAKGRTKQYVLPARMDSVMLNTGGGLTAAIKLTGSKTFYEVP